jgi:hypothetical protein
MQLIYMLMTQMGRYLEFYGNASAAGVKGQGAGPSDCFLSYENLAINPATNFATYFAGGVTGNCNAGNYLTGGHVGLGAPGTYDVGRVCQGAVIMNSFFNIFPSVLGTIAGNDFPWASSLETAISTAKSSMETALPGTLARIGNVLSQTNCVTLNTGNDDFLQVYFAFMMETLFQ